MEPTLKRRTGARWTTLLSVLILLLAFALRAYHLGWQSVWSDEGISIVRSSQGLGDLIRNMPVEHVPGYFLLLHFWLPIAGLSDFALRFPSLFASVLAVALCCRLARDLGLTWAGLIAGVLLATGVFQVWYGQEARMYSWLLAAGLGSTWFFWRLLAVDDGPGRRRVWLVDWAGYVACTATAIYMHHYGFLVPASQTLFAVGWVVATRRGRSFLRWAGAGAAVLVAYLPWVPHFVKLFGFPGWRPPLSPWALPWRYVTAYTAGDAMPEPWHTALPWVYAALAALGLALLWRRRRSAALLLGCMTLLPLAGALALALRRPDYHERYTIFVSAPLVLLAAQGLVGWFAGLRPRAASAGRAVAGARLAGVVIPAVLLAGLVTPNALGLRRLYEDASVQKPDYKTPVSRLENSQQPGDVVLLDGMDPNIGFLHYYTGGLPWHDLRPLQKASYEQVDQALSAATMGARRVWLFRQYQAKGAIEAWLAGHGWLAAESFYNGLYFSVYGLPALPAAGHDLGLAYPPFLDLAGWDLVGGTSTAPDTFAAGDLVGITTRWQVLQTPPDLKFSLRLMGSDGAVWTAADYVSRDGFAPTAGWQPGTTVTDQRALWLPGDLPPGDYTLALVVYREANGEPLARADGDAGPLTLDSVHTIAPVRPPLAGELTIPQPASHVLSGATGNSAIRVLGTGIEPQPLQMEQKPVLSVWWQVLPGHTPPDQVLIDLAGAPGQYAARKLYPLAGQGPAAWQPGEIVHMRYALELNPAAPGGDYRLELSVGTPAQQGAVWQAGSVKFLGAKPPQ